MSRIDTRVIMSGANPDIMGSMQRGWEAGRKNALAQMYQKHGPGIMAGDQTAINALAAFDPAAAMNIQNTRQAMDARSQLIRLRSAQENRAQAAETRAEAAETRAAATHDFNMEQAIEKARRDTITWTQTQDDRTVAAELAELERGLTSLLPHMQTGNFAAANEILREMELPPVDSREALMATIGMTEASRDAMKEVLKMTAGPDQFTLITGQDAAALGLDPEKAYNLGPDGKVTAVGGGGTNITVNTAEQTDVTNPTSPVAMMYSIDGVLSDPALDWATGFLEWTQNIPGTGAARFGSRVDQLNGQAFLQAFEKLKGGGQITEIEGQKATQAIGRLDTAQSAADYRAALTELRDLLAIGLAREAGAVNEPEPQTPGARMKYNIETGQFE